MINRTVLVGRLTRDPELRYTTNGAAVASFTVAVNRTFTNAQGEREADFINCTIWRKAAENFANLVHKGSLVGIDGRIQTRNYEKDGQRVYVTEVIVDNFSKLEWDNDSNGQSNGRADNQASKSNNTNDYSQKRADNVQKNNNTDPFADNSKPIDISDSDLPF
ncbi:single-stranded DNA-binding protein [Companilactobacillus nantensis]|uniref:Single-stranded DNA-binding protein n=1 Tax=Companilactobacillus nantensis DSM 16982 TaxID=1423774 RepID=A0A0R1WHF3_9LACO|nr:single-stranded DNA-binding protein [Companilactobacillus nantensis]KRM17280.1 single-strand DNA binding protein [Companilactobacillus nantensis DSM 16982]GEO63990.1 single-stranded DNA-binding protein [Companilactobacillus nantensis]